jgi:hypothetical protein
MTEAEWLFGRDPVALLLSLQAIAGDRKLRLYAVSVTRAERDEGTLLRYWDPHLSAAEQIADGLLPLNPHSGCDLEWRTAREVAYDAAWYGDAKWTLCKCQLLREIFGNPFRPATFSPSWRTNTAVSLARQMYESREFSAMPILADALQDAGCDNEDVLNHCREAGVHVRGCWVVDLLLGKG